MKIKKSYWAMLLILMNVVFYLFWGPLFPWSPIKIGYATIEGSKSTVYIDDMSDRDSIVYQIDEIIREEEKFHDLSYKDNFRIVILNEESNMKRYVPWLKGSDYSVSLSSLNLIYIGPNARKSQWGIGPYLKHELSHLLIGQNTTLEKALKIHEQGWFAEGIAEYFSEHGFYTKNELLQLIKMGKLSISTLKEKNPLNMSKKELVLKYSYYRFFIEYLVDNYGTNKLQKFLKSYINNPEGYKTIFYEVYNTEIDNTLKNYNTSLGMQL